MTGTAARARASALGAQDVLLLRRLRGAEWFHVGGLGRSAGWAGALSAAERVVPTRGAGDDDDEAPDEPLLRRASTSAGGVRVLAGSPTRVVGPYWAATAVLVRPHPDVVAVWGHPARSSRLLAASDAELCEASLALLASLDADADAGPAQALAHELHVLQAASELTASLHVPVPEALHRIASVLAQALDCQLAAAWLGDGRGEVAERGWSTSGADAAVVAAAASAVPGAGEPPRVGAPDGAAGGRSALPSPLSPSDGVRSTLVVGLDVPGGGGLLAARAGGPGGTGGAGAFTAASARVAAQLGATAGTVLQVALAREEVERQLSDTRLQLRKDSLTSAGSRHQWDAELAAAQDLVDSGVPVCVALLDLDDLKWVNDTHGHPAGDELLRTCADAVRGCLRGGSDVVARVGGDEFAVLVPRASDPASLGARLRRGVEGATTSFGVAVAVSIGVALCEPGGRVAEAFADADAAMFADKRDRKAARGAAPRAGVVAG